MKNALILPIGLILTGIIISGVVYNYDLSSLTDPSNDDKTNLTTEEAIALAIHDISVSEFIRQTQAYADAEHDKGIWTVRFTEINNLNRFIEVEIDDVTELILNSEQNGESVNLSEGQQFKANNEADFYSPSNGVSSQEDSEAISDSRGGLIEDYYYYTNPELIEAAIEYFTDLDIIVDFLIDYPLEFYGYSYDNSIVNLWGYDNENYEVWMNAVLNVQEIDEDNWEFSLEEISSSVIFGNPIHDFVDMQDIVELTSEFTEFVDKVENYTLYEVLYYHIDENQDPQYVFSMRYSPLYYYFLDYPVDDTDASVSSSEGSTSSDQGEDLADVCYCYYNDWVEFEVSDRDGLIENIWGPDSAFLSADEALSLMVQNTEIQLWSDEINNYSNYTYYDGYGNWWISLYDVEDYYNYAHARLNDRTHEVDEIYTALSTPATKTELQLHTMLINLQETELFFDVVSDYEYYFYYDHYGVWYFSYYDVNNYYNYIWGSISDEDLTLLELQVKVYKEPSLTERSVVELLENVGLSDFENQYPMVSYSVYYDGYDTWYVYGYSMILIDAWFWAQIEDTTGDIIEYTENHPTNLPDLTVDEVMSIAHATGEYKEIKEKADISYEYYYYYDGRWYYYSQGTDEENFYWLSISIDDDTGEIEDIWYSSWIYINEVYPDPGYHEKDDE